MSVPTSTPTSIPAIRVSHVSKNFHYWSERPTSLKTLLVEMSSGKFNLGSLNRLNVLTDISFEIRKGEFVGIMGRNGAGKSTILKLLSGIYPANSGKIEINGSLAPLIELGAGFNGELSGFENIFLNAAILGFGRKATKGALDKIIEFSGLGDLIHMPVKNYSSGMTVRLGFAIATHLVTDILLIDEILAVGDFGFAQKCIKKIQELHAAGHTIVLITHDSDAVRRFCSRCIVVEQHKVIFDGPPDRGSEIYLETVIGAIPGNN